MSARQAGGGSRSTAVIIPVKGENPKGRLSGFLTLGQRRQLQVAMLEDTLQTLIKARIISHTFVVSSDARILEFAHRFGGNSVAETKDAGVNAAVARGLEETPAYDRRMIVPADLPLLTVEDLKLAPMLVREGSEVVIGPSETFDGTNMLLLTRGNEMELHYDDDSFRKHVAGANSMGLRASVYYSRGVGFDIDKPSDVHRFFRFQRRGSTLTFLGRTLRKAERERAQRN